MDIQYKRLSDNELETFITMRITQLREEGAKEDMDLRPALRSYIDRAKRGMPLLSEESALYILLSALGVMIETIAIMAIYSLYITKKYEKK